VQRAAHGLTEEDSIVLPNGIAIVCASGSVVNFVGDAIVNAANEGCVGGGGVDGAINSAGGYPLVEARRRLGGCPTGEAKTTPAFGLRSVRHIIHAVGPAFRLPAGADPSSDASVALFAAKDRQLASAYASAVREATRVDASTVAFALISSGVFRGSRSLEAVLRTGLSTLLSVCAELQRPVAAACGGGRLGAASEDPLLPESCSLTTGPAESVALGSLTHIYMVAYTDEELRALLHVFELARSGSS